MKSSIRQPRYFGSSGRKVVLALALATVMGAMSISPALADTNDGRDRQNQRHWRGDHRDGYYNGYRPQYRRPYVYAQPVYVPPPVYYEPRQSPGISLFLPLDLRR
jgi:hypothetical protein